MIQQPKTVRDALSMTPSEAISIENSCLELFSDKVSTFRRMTFELLLILIGKSKELLIN